MLNKEILKATGLTDNEVEVYLILLNLGEATVYKIAEQSKISRPNIYDTVKKLAEKSLVSFVVKNNKKYFKAINPEKLLDILRDREKNFIEMLPELSEIYKSKAVQPIIEVFQGSEGLRTIMNDMIKTKKDIWIFSGTDINQIYSEVPKYYVDRLLKEKKEHGIKTRMLYSKDVKPVKGPGYQFKKLPTENLGCVNYWTYGDRVIIGIWTKPMMIIRIISQDVARVYQKSVKLIWDSIKR